MSDLIEAFLLGINERTTEGAKNALAEAAAEMATEGEVSDYDEGDWEPHVIESGPRKGQQAYKNRSTGEIQDTLPVGAETAGDDTPKVKVPRIKADMDYPKAAERAILGLADGEDHSSVDLDTIKAEVSTLQGKAREMAEASIEPIHKAVMAKAGGSFDIIAKAGGDPSELYSRDEIRENLSNSAEAIAEGFEQMNEAARQLEADLASLDEIADPAQLRAERERIGDEFDNAYHDGLQQMAEGVTDLKEEAREMKTDYVSEVKENARMVAEDYENLEAELEEINTTSDPDRKEELIERANDFLETDYWLLTADDTGKMAVEKNPDFFGFGEKPEQFDEGDWQPHVIKSGPRKGQHAFKNQTTGEIRDTAPAGESDSDQDESTKELSAKLSPEALADLSDEDLEARAKELAGQIPGPEPQEKQSLKEKLKGKVAELKQKWDEIPKTPAGLAKAGAKGALNAARFGVAASVGVLRSLWVDATSNYIKAVLEYGRTVGKGVKAIGKKRRGEPLTDDDKQAIVGMLTEPVTLPGTIAVDFLIPGTGFILPSAYANEKVGKLFPKGLRDAASEEGSSWWTPLDLLSKGMKKLEDFISPSTDKHAEGLPPLTEEEAAKLLGALEALWEHLQGIADSDEADEAGDEEAPAREFRESGESGYVTGWGHKLGEKYRAKAPKRDRKRG